MSATERQERVEDGSAPVDDTSLGDGRKLNMKPLVYVAGPYAHPDPVLNTREACLVADRIVEMGGAPIIPHLSLLWHAISPQAVDTWYERDLDVLRHCDVLVRFPGVSVGADAEVADANEWGITTFLWNTDNEPHIQTWIEGWRP